MDSTRIPAVIEASKIQDDKLSTKINSSMKSIRCHRNCVEIYVSQQNLKGLKRVVKEEVTLPSPKKLRCNTDVYDPKRHCLYHLKVSLCLLPHEQSKLPRHRRVPASAAEQKQTDDGQDYVKFLLARCA